MPAAQIDKRFYDTPYYIAPNDRVGQEAFAVIRDAMKGKGMVALGRVVMAKRERVIALEPSGKGLLGTTLRYAYEVRKPTIFSTTSPTSRWQARCSSLPSTSSRPRTGDFEPETFTDRYEEAVVEFLRKKQAHIPVKKTKEAEAPRNVINLMEALRKSVKEAPPPAKTKAKKRVAGQTEMLLAIQGKGTPRGAAKAKPGRAGTAAEPRRAGKRSA